jgi:hypothetical protein
MKTGATFTLSLLFSLALSLAEAAIAGQAL